VRVLMLVSFAACFCCFIVLGFGHSIRVEVSFGLGCSTGLHRQIFYYLQSRSFKTYLLHRRGYSASLTCWRGYAISLTLSFIRCYGSGGTSLASNGADGLAGTLCPLEVHLLLRF
jgi:hypothetical protein